MSLLAVALAVSVIPSCDWADRGLDKFKGDVPSAVDTYKEIPQQVREALKRKMEKRAYDDVAHLTASGQQSKSWVYSMPYMMHFGDGSRLCATIDISRWRKDDEGERGLVYCDSGYCVIVYTVCRNVSRVDVLGPVRPIPPTQPTPDPMPTSEVDPLLVPPMVTVPDIEPGPLADELPQSSFARQTVPEPVPQPSTDDTPAPNYRISTDQGFYDLWARPAFREQFSWAPLFWLTTAVPAPIKYVAPETPPTVMPPVPGVVPPSQMPLPPTVVKPVGPVEPTDTGEADHKQTQPIPEPGTYVLMALGLAIVYMMTRRRRTT